MRIFLILVVAVGSLRAIDEFRLDSRYSRAVWQEANFQGQKFNYEMQRWLRKANF